MPVHQRTNREPGGCAHDHYFGGNCDVHPTCLNALGIS